MKTMITTLAVAAIAGISIMGTTADACSGCKVGKKMEKKECCSKKKKCSAEKKKCSAEKKKCCGSKKK